MTGTTIPLSQEALGQVHAFLRGSGNDLADAVAQTREARTRGAVTWSGTLTPATIHGLGAIHALARDEGARATLTHAGLNERETSFFEDFYAYGPGAASSLGLNASELFAAIHEAFFAAVQMMRPAARKALAPAGKALIIGAYGGDHVGDTAILGGVLLHLSQQFGISQAEVLSHRPAHTARLVRGLDTPVSVVVSDYTPATIARRVPEAGLIMIAGGPMMDFPRVLAKHLGAIYLARSRGIPIYIERVGVGPFKRQLSRWAARRIFSQAERISLRSSGDGRDAAIAGLDFKVGRDPAFDYLGTRSSLSRKTAASSTIEKKLADIKGNLLVGINLRPIRHELSLDGASKSKAFDSQFFQNLSEAMIRFATASALDVTYIFYPMNPIEFGQSDLAAAYRLHRLVAGKVDFQVWEADPDIDDVLGLLRQLDAVIAMRFHAAIFSLSQNTPTFGVDYCPSRKVEQLFADLGRPEDAVQIDKFSPDWLVDKLATLAGIQGAMECEA